MVTVGLVVVVVIFAAIWASRYIKVGPNEEGVYGMMSANTTKGLANWSFRPVKSITPGRIVFADATGSFSIEKTLDGGIRLIEAEEAKLRQRRADLADKERQEVLKRLEKSPLGKMSLVQVEGFLSRVKALGIEEVLKRLA